MKNSRFAFLVFVLQLLYPTFVTAAPPSLESKITGVTIYPQQVLVTREARTQISAGEGTVVVGPLAVGLNENSLRIEMEGPPGTQLSGHEVKTTFGLEASSAEVEKLEARLEQLYEKMAELDHRKLIAEDGNKYLASLEAASGEQIGKSLVTEAPVTAEATSVYDFVKTKQLENYGIIESAGRELKPLKKEEEQVRKELDRLRSQSTPDSKEVRVRFTTDQAGEAAVRVSYLMYGAYWQPVYDVRSADDLVECEIRYFARVTQQTGEDWNDVSVALSTAKPELGAAMPELFPWYVGIQEPVPVSNMRRREDRFNQKFAALGMASSRGDAVMAESEAYAPPPSEPASFEESVMEQYGSYVTYKIETKANIPSDGEPHQVPIVVKTFPLNIKYITTPRLVPVCYIKASLTNHSDAVFLSGQAFIFRGNDFIGEGFLKETQPGDSVEDLFLGVDDRIKVKFYTLKEFSNDNVLFGTHVAKERKYKIDLKNLLDRQVAVEVMDHQPVSQDQDVSVELFDVEPKPAADLRSEEASEGKIKWEMMLPAGAEDTIEFGFRVKYKKGTNVYGI